MSLLIDFVILALLAGVLAYAYLVDRRVRNLVQVLRQLEPMVNEFSAAVDKSEDSVSTMKAMTESIAQKLRRRADPDPAAEAAPHAADAAPGDHGVSFRSQRSPAEPPAGVAALSGKDELVRSFFDSVRSREA
ncbi:flagellar motor switch protein [Pseudooceanicola sp.]|uniref:flagellar motor switch protein n=1 Tax=Pseudooceanicola sp. TaxID=1914328 RepID=UPI003519A30B